MKANHQPPHNTKNWYPTDWWDESTTPPEVLNTQTIIQKIHRALAATRGERSGAIQEDFWMGRTLAMVIGTLRMWDKLERSHPDLFLKIFALSKDEPNSFKQLFDLKVLMETQAITRDQNVENYMLSLPGFNADTNKFNISEKTMDNHGFVVMALCVREIPKLLRGWVDQELEHATKISLETNVPQAMKVMGQKFGNHL